MQISTSPPRNPFNPDAFGESLMFNGTQHFAPHSCGAFAASEGVDATFMRSHSNPPIQRMPRSAGLEPLTSSAAFPPNEYASAVRPVPTPLPRKHQVYGMASATSSGSQSFVMSPVVVYHNLQGARAGGRSVWSIAAAASVHSCMLNELSVIPACRGSA